MFNDSLDQALLICLGYAYFFSIPETEYAYKRYAYKKNMYYIFLDIYLSVIYNHNIYLFL